MDRDAAGSPRSRCGLGRPSEVSLVAAIVSRVTHDGRERSSPRTQGAPVSIRDTGATEDAGMRRFADGQADRGRGRGHVVSVTWLKMLFPRTLSDRSSAGGSGARTSTSSNASRPSASFRPWYAPPGKAVLVSINLRPKVDVARLPELSLVAGQAAADAIAETTGITPETQFPNDLLIDGRKVAGILAEARDGRVVLGIGINANLAEEELPTNVDKPATSLLVERGEEIDRARLLAALLARL